MMRYKWTQPRQYFPSQAYRSMMPPIMPSLSVELGAAAGGSEADQACADNEDDMIVDVVGGASVHVHSARHPPVVQHHHAVITIPATIQLGPGGKKYHCQRCLNHNLEIPRKGHKRVCRFADCQCDDCKLVEKRKILNREINSEREGSDKQQQQRLSSNSPPIVVSVGGDGVRGSAVEKEIEVLLNKAAAASNRNPRCARCRAHNPDQEPPPLKGHKKACRYKTCECKKCSLITCRRDVMAKQIRLRRKQKSKNAPSSDSNAPPSNSNSNSRSPPALTQHQQLSPARTMTKRPRTPQVKSTTNAKITTAAIAAHQSSMKPSIPNPYLQDQRQKQSDQQQQSAASTRQKVCVDLCTPPAIEVLNNSTSGGESNGRRSYNNDASPVNGAVGQTVRPQPTYGLIPTMPPTINPTVDYCATGSPVTTVNPFSGAATVHIPQQPPPPVPSAAVATAAALGALCPQQLFAGFLQYVQAVASAAVVQQAVPQQPQSINHGLTLPTMPAAAFSRPLGAAGYYSSMSNVQFQHPALLAAAVAHHQQQQQEHHNHQLRLMASSFAQHTLPPPHHNPHNLFGLP